MVIATKGDLLNITPVQRISENPVSDDLTARMQKAWDLRKDSGIGIMGFRTCRCGERASGALYLVETADGETFRVNGLCVHYIMWHRDEVPEAELAKVALLPEC